MTSHCCQNLSARKKKSRKEKEERKKETEEKNSRKIENGLHLKWLQHITPETIIIFIIVYCPRLHTHTAYCLESCFITMDTVQIDRPFVYKIYYLQLSSKNSSCIPTACPCSHALTCQHVTCGPSTTMAKHHSKMLLHFYPPNSSRLVPDMQKIDGVQQW